MVFSARSRTLGLVGLLTTACAVRAPVALPGPDEGKRVVAERGVVSSANPLASEAGLAMLRRGGNAIDAAVATAFAIGVVEPQMSGVGGGGAALVWLASQQNAQYIDFYSAQPARPFRESTGQDTGNGALRIVAIPGSVRGLLSLHERFGRLTRADVMAPAIDLAETGFPINQVLAEMIDSDSAKLFRFETSRNMLWPDGKPLAAGTRFRNPELAETLRTIAREGERGFYQGHIAQALIDALNAGGHPATLQDLAEFEPEWKRPLCTDYRGRVVLSAPPPQTGTEILHVLEMLERFDLGALGLPTRDARAFDILVSALRVGIADHRTNDDPAWVAVPAAGIASAAFAEERASLVGQGRAPDSIQTADAGRFDNAPAPASCSPYEPYGAIASGDALPRSEPEDDDEAGETTHISVVDEAGNAVALTQTNSTTFGSGASVGGFFLNDSGYRFTPESARQAARDDWRTRTSTIAPTIVLDEGRAHMVVGAPGGGRIPPAILQAMVYTLDYGLDPLEAVRMPRMFPSPSNAIVQLETGFAADVLERARAMGYQPAPPGGGYARLYMIVRRDGRWIGVADPRHNGEVRGW